MGKASRRKRERRLGKPLAVPRNVPASLPGPGHRILRNHGRAKISESLIDLIRPFSTDGADLEQFRGLVAIGAIAWNLAIMDDESLDEALQLFADESIHDREFFESLVTSLVLRKRQLFPDDRRIVAGWEVTPQPDGRFFVTAAAAGME